MEPASNQTEETETESRKEGIIEYDSLANPAKQR